MKVIPDKTEQVIVQIYRSCFIPLESTLDSIGDGQLNWKPLSASRSIAEIARHLVRVDNWFIKQIGIVPETEDPGEKGAAEIAEVLQKVDRQVHEILAACVKKNEWKMDTESPELKDFHSIAGVVIHMAQHHLYHLAQMIYLRRAQDREWRPPLEQ